MGAPIENVAERDTVHIVIVGHVDHGKSTLVGRLLADTDTLGEGKLEAVQETCRQQGKAFEYAFLLDALEAEQEQGITIDAARVFFRTEKRDYIIIDAPGHIEFLKNMVTGAARAETAVLLIDAKEGVRENSRRHGFLLSMLGIRQVVVAVNKMDLVDYSKEVFDAIVSEYREFLAEIDLQPQHFVPVSAREGDLIASRSEAMSWYDGPTILEAVDGFEKASEDEELPLRLPVQDVYKFNFRGDDRRIIAGRVEAGRFTVGDKVIFSPSNKTATIKSIEIFNGTPPTSVGTGLSTGVTLDQELFIERGEIMSHVDTAPQVSTLARVNLFWLGREPMSPNKRYKLKQGTFESEVRIEEIKRVLDASDLDATNDKTQVERHDVADLVLRTRKAMAYDLAADLEVTGRFVIVDGYDIAGGGIIREFVADDTQQWRMESKIRDLEWSRGHIRAAQRAEMHGHRAAMVMLTGDVGVGKAEIAIALEKALFDSSHHAYLLDGRNLVLGVDADIQLDDRSELVRRFGEVAYLLLDAGVILVSTTNVIGLADHRQIETQISPYPMFVANIGEGETAGDDADIQLDPSVDAPTAAAKIVEALAERGWLRSE